MRLTKLNKRYKPLPPVPTEVTRELFQQWAALYGQEAALEIANLRLAEQQMNDVSSMLIKISKIDHDAYLRIVNLPPEYAFQEVTRFCQCHASALNQEVA